MDPDAKECFEAAAEMLQQATGCHPAMAGTIVTQIALGTLRWGADRRQLDNQLFHAWSTGFETGRKKLGPDGGEK